MSRIVQCAVCNLLLCRCQAYKNFGVRVSNLRKRLDDVKKTLPDPLSPIPSPTLDAPSPAESPVDENVDNVETVDMELSSSDEGEH